MTAYPSLERIMKNHNILYTTWVKNLYGFLLWQCSTKLEILKVKPHMDNCTFSESFTIELTLKRYNYHLI